MIKKNLKMLIVTSIIILLPILDRFAHQKDKVTL